MNKIHRLKELDYMKGILICLVLIGHIALQIENSYICSFIYSFHMPAFFL